MARRSTRRGQVRKTARRAYVGIKRRTRRSRRRVYYAARRRTRRTTRGLMKGQSGRAVKDCGMIAGGDAAAMLATRFMGPQIAGLDTPTVIGAGLIGWGVYKNKSQPIYAGFGALYPMIHNRMAGLIAGQ